MRVREIGESGQGNGHDPPLRRAAGALKRLICPPPRSPAAAHHHQAKVGPVFTDAAPAYEMAVKLAALDAEAKGLQERAGRGSRKPR
jgi:hypothetical protein